MVTADSALVYPRQFADRYRCVWLDDGQPRSEVIKVYEVEAAGA